MPSTQRIRWIVIVTTLDGQITSYGPWYDSDKAEKHVDQLRRRSARYTANERHRDFEVDIVALTRWPGVKNVID